jgi:hypothetical protein
MFGKDQAQEEAKSLLLWCFDFNKLFYAQYGIERGHPETPAGLHRLYQYRLLKIGRLPKHVENTKHT